MQLPQTTKYGFRIRTRSGAAVDNLLISGKDEFDAERKLRQIYLGCEILEMKRMQPQTGSRGGPVNYEDIVDLLSDPPSIAPAK
jgi:hypothetical protein